MSEVGWVKDNLYFDKLNDYSMANIFEFNNDWFCTMYHTSAAVANPPLTGGEGFCSSSIQNTPISANRGPNERLVNTSRCVGLSRAGEQNPIGA